MATSPIKEKNTLLDVYESFTMISVAMFLLSDCEENSFWSMHVEHFMQRFHDFFY